MLLESHDKKGKRQHEADKGGLSPQSRCEKASSKTQGLRVGTRRNSGCGGTIARRGRRFCLDCGARATAGSNGGVHVTSGGGNKAFKVIN